MSIIRQANVFDWAQVKLAQECLTVLFKANTSKQHVVAQLASAGGVSVTWDEDGLVKLEGPWEHILKSQTVFQNYLKSLQHSDSPDFKTSSESEEEQKKVTMVLKESNPPIENLVREEDNEVYVNITLSNSIFSNHESVEVVHSINEGKVAKHTIPKKKIEDLCSKIDTSELSNLTKSGTDKNAPTLMKILKRNESVDEKTDYLHGVFKPRNLPTSNSEKYVDEKYSVRESNSLNKQHISNISSTHNSYGEVLNSLKIPSLNDNKQRKISTELLETKSQSNNKNSKCDSVLHVTPASSKVNRGYRKKKDYEELAPFKFFCALCSFKSKRESHFTKHMKLHNAVSELFKCTQCAFTSIRLSHLRRHELSHSNLTFSCNLCQYRTNNEKLLVRHKHIKHSAKKVSEGDTKKDILHCVHCDYQTSRYCFLQRHMRIHVTDTSSVQVYQCEQCSYKTNRKEHFVRHTNNIHKGQRPFLCHRCGKAFKRQDALKQHTAIHATLAVVTCPECGKGCKSQAHLSQHMPVHSTDRSFLCELCGACFKTRAVQRKHMITIHQHPKAFLCTHCSRKFSTKFALRRHIKQHNFPTPVEKKIKHDQQVSTTAVIPYSINPLRLVTTSSEENGFPVKSPASQQNTTLVTTSREGEKITLQLTETFDTGIVPVIPAQPVMQCKGEATTLVYLAGTFTPT